MKKYSGIKLIGFDADDTLWENENYFREAEADFYKLMLPFVPEERSSEILFNTLMRDLPRHGYGIKSFMLGMCSAASEIAGKALSPEHIEGAVRIGHRLMERPVELLPDAEGTLSALSKRYPLVMITKGDRRDQLRKIRLSGLEKYFTRTLIVDDKRAEDYLYVLSEMKCASADFLMVGNSMRSDVIPPLEIGARAVHIPYWTLWEHEIFHGDESKYDFTRLEKISDLPSLLADMV